MKSWIASATSLEDGAVKRRHRTESHTTRIVSLPGGTRGNANGRDHKGSTPPLSCVTTRSSMFTQRLLHCLLTLCCAAALTSQASATSTAAPCQPLSKGETIRLDFNETPLRDVVRVISCATRQNIIMRPTKLEQRRVTLVAPTPVKAKDLLPLLRAALRSAGLVGEPKGTYLVIRPKDAQLPSKRRSSKGR